jgi:hypothetical protein
MKKNNEHLKMKMKLEKAKKELNRRKGTSNLKVGFVLKELQSDDPSSSDNDDINS